MPIYNQIGGSYNSTRTADPTIARKILEHLRPIQNGKFLDLACGTGNYSIAYKIAGLHIVGVDQSELMIERAQSQDASLEWCVGSAENLPFEDGLFQGVTYTNAIHHFRDLGKATRECARVTSEGRIVIFCSTQEQMEKYWLNHYFPEMMRKSIEQMPTRKRILDCLAESAFREITCEPFVISPNLEDLFLYSAKQRPELYLNEEFRKNISSFASLANEREVRVGLARLMRDIESGQIKKVMSNFENDDGDYLIVSASKHQA